MRAWQASSCKGLNLSKAMVAVCIAESRNVAVGVWTDCHGGEWLQIREAALSSALPRQAGMAPATGLAALAVGVLVALKAFEHVVRCAIAGLAGQTGGLIRAGAAAADKHDQRFRVDL